VLVSKFLALDGEMRVSPDEVQQLNRNLSALTATEIPRKKVEQVQDYLIAVLNFGSVDPQIRPALEKLASDLQEGR